MVIVLIFLFGFFVSRCDWIRFLGLMLASTIVGNFCCCVFPACCLIFDVWYFFGLVGLNWDEMGWTGYTTIPPRVLLLIAFSRSCCCCCIVCLYVFCALCVLVVVVQVIIIIVSHCHYSFVVIESSSPSAPARNL